MTDSQAQEQDRAEPHSGDPIFLGSPHGYWAESRRPLASLLFILPFLVVYEVGILILGPAATRNGVDVWLRHLLEWMGFGQYFLLPLLTIVILLSWQYTSREPWRISRGVLCGMLVESLALALCLRLILHMQDMLLNLSPTFSNLIMFLGAGIYEELLFRLIFLTAAAWILHSVGLQRTLSILSAVIITSLLFSGAHYIGPQGEQMQIFSFTFRFVAGVFFCALFVFRGFGIAAGTHAAYDIVVGLF